MTEPSSQVAATSEGVGPWKSAAGLLVVAVALAWSFWETLAALVDDWTSDDNYSVGMLVPLAALWMVWHRRRCFAALTRRICWWGVAVVVAGGGMRLFGLLFLFESAERYGLWLTVVGLVIWLGGPRVAWQARWILLFLLLAIPWPGRIHNAVSAPLQGLATRGAVVALDMIGVTVLRHGNVVILNDAIPVAVAEACSGLRMLTAFMVVAAVLAFVVDRPKWQKTVVFVSSVPIAIVCNLVRLVVTAGLFLVASSQSAERFFHDFAGLFMMPLAMGLMVLELWVLSKLVTAEGGERR